MKLAKIESVYRQNMLVNGDFNVNQRKQSSYTGEGYGLDMWKIRTSGTMTIHSGYVSFVGNSFAQFISVSNFETSDYTVIIKLLNEDARVYHFNSFTGDYVEITLPNDTKVKCSLQYVDSKYIMLIVWPLTGSAVNVEYIDMFKGAIAFNHVYENYDTALARCLRYLLYLKGQSASAGFVNLDGTTAVISIPLPMPLKEIPHCKAYIIHAIIDGVGSFAISGIYVLAMSNNMLTLGGTVSTNSHQGKFARLYFPNADSYLSISCEI